MVLWARASRCRFVDHPESGSGCRHAAEALVFNERTAIGLDVHARSVRAAAIDSLTGEVIASAEVVPISGLRIGVEPPAPLRRRSGESQY